MTLVIRVNVISFLVKINIAKFPSNYQSELEMKAIQKLILPLLILVVIAIVYVVYFSPDEGLGSFADFDTNNSAVKDIKVQVLPDRGINSNPGGGANFYTVDKSGTVVLVQADHVPSGIESARTVVLRGHLNKENFHAHDVLLD